MEEGGKVVFNLQRLPPSNRVGFPVVSSLRLTHLLSLSFSLSFLLFLRHVQKPAHMQKQVHTRRQRSKCNTTNMSYEIPVGRLKQKDKLLE